MTQLRRFMQQHLGISCDVVTGLHSPSLPCFLPRFTCQSSPHTRLHLTCISSSTLNHHPNCSVGSLLGEGLYRSARTAGWVTTFIGGGFMGACAAFVLGGRDFVGRIFTKEDPVSSGWSPLKVLQNPLWLRVDSGS